MTVLRWIVAVILAAAVLYLAGVNSRGRPELITHTENGFTFEYLTVPKAIEQGEAEIPITITGNWEPGLKAGLRTTLPGWDENVNPRRYHYNPLKLIDSTAGHFRSLIPTTRRGGQVRYYFEIRDRVGGLRASLMAPDGKPFTLKFVGEVPGWLLAGHIGLMALTVFFIVLGFLYALPTVAGGSQLRPMVTSILLAAVATFLGGYVFGPPMNYYTFGTVWEGVPFGTDATDNKTQLLFLYLLFVTLLSAGTLFKGKLGGNLFSEATLGWFGVGAFILMGLVYLIPHSIQFAATLTRVICYSFPAVLVLIYVLGRLRLRSRRVAEEQPATE